mmetsp:Transcript_20369/g.52149  ORF Transcript_20369/g.52149 Transcript_20369/m.52149 type:complete len:267 (-) Transcript_20369:765-1565(-)
MLASSSAYGPEYLNRAASSRSPVERMSLVIAYYIAGLHCSTGFRKPLNPILGETLESVLDDGTEVYFEQTSHHPPRSHWLIEGKGYKYHGWVGYKAKIGLNTLKIHHRGARIIDFDDGGQITYTNPIDQYNGVLVGQIKHQTFGCIEFRDEKNGLSCDLRFRPSSKLPSDVLYGEIMDKNQKVVCRVEGSWLGFCYINGKKVWDIKTTPRAKMERKANALPSDATFREDAELIRKMDWEEAQECKKRLEEKQRFERKLRKKYGPKK